MKSPLTATFALLACAAGSLAETQPTALGAIKLLPHGEAKKIARIEAREGTPAPERWYILTHDDKAENGLHEYVVAGGEVVASRTLSQFAESVKPDDVIGGDALKIDSDKAAKLAQQFALANNLTVATMNFELKKDGAAASPLWTVTCVDEAGKELGQLVVTAARGSVVSHDGFALEPAGAQPPPKPKMTTQAAPTVVTTEAVKRPPAKPPEPEVERKPGFFNRLGASMQKAFSGKETQAR